MEQRTVKDRLRLLLWGVALSVFLEPSAGAQASYYVGKSEGWFWKELIPDPSPPDLMSPETAQAQAPPETLERPMRSKDAQPLSAAWLREKLPEYRDRAIEDPTPENVRAFYYLQRYAMDLAERFAQVAQRVVISDPGLDENARRPISSYGGQVFDQVARDETLRVATQIAAKAGVWYFFRSDCPYCQAENPVLARLQRRIGLAVLPISLDGRAMSNSEFPRFVPDRGHARQLGVTATPTLYLVREPQQFALLSEGLVTDDELLTRMVLAAHEAGWITDEEFNSTQPRKPPAGLEFANERLEPKDSGNLVEWLRTYERSFKSGS
jgi:conjugal transfer pilus assembly protein TraF